MHVTANGHGPASRHAPKYVFIGFMGGGKTTAARAFASSADLTMADVDREVEAKTGEQIGALFETKGEGAFRRVEEELTLALLDKGPRVLALGGGALESPLVRSAVQQHVVVWCDVDEETAWRRAESSDRPLARNRHGFAELYEARASAYEQVARVWLQTKHRNAIHDAANWISKLSAHADLRMLWADSRSGKYPAVIGQGALALTPRDRPWFVVADKAALASHKNRLPDSLFTDPARVLELLVTEGLKTFRGAEEILEKLVDAEASRQDGLLAFGGGVVGDLAGFCAALFHRDGIPILQAPTTLLSQVDSAYGGKTGVNLKNAKHQVGAYHMPTAVLADTGTLETLPAREIRSGFVEVIKTALIAGGSLWQRVRALSSLNRASLEPLIFDCVRTKLRIVAADEREEGVRAWLNLGHTVGHAIEVATGYKQYTHGEAVGLGLLAVLRLSGTNYLRDEVEDLLGAHGLPTTLAANVSADDVAKAVRNDKKRSFVVLDAPGKLRTGVPIIPAEVVQVVRELQVGVGARGVL